MGLFVAGGGRCGCVGCSGLVEVSPEGAEFGGPLGDYPIHLPWRIPGVICL